MNEEKLYTLDQAQLEFAKKSFNSLWPLLEKPNRTLEEDRDLTLAAFASLYHWKRVGTAVHEQRGSWMISRVFQVLGRKHAALEWALRCYQITEDHLSDMEDFDIAYAQEGMARAYALTDDEAKALEHWHKAVELGDKIKNPEDKEIYLGDLRGGNWYNLQVD